VVVGHHSGGGASPSQSPSPNSFFFSISELNCSIVNRLAASSTNILRVRVRNLGLKAFNLCGVDHSNSLRPSGCAYQRMRASLPGDQLRSLPAVTRHMAAGRLWRSVQVMRQVDDMRRGGTVQTAFPTFRHLTTFRNPQPSSPRHSWRDE
jgi:hypothetical protein